MTNWLHQNPADSKDMYGIPSNVQSDTRIRPWGMGKSEEENMSGSETTHSGLTRRGFLKSAGAVVALSGFSGLVGCTRNYDKSLATTGSEDQIFYGTCRGNCAGARRC